MILKKLVKFFLLIFILIIFFFTQIFLKKMKKKVKLRSKEIFIVQMLLMTLAIQQKTLMEMNIIKALIGEIDFKIQIIYLTKVMHKNS